MVVLAKDHHAQKEGKLKTHNIPKCYKSLCAKCVPSRAVKEAKSPLDS